MLNRVQLLIAVAWFCKGCVTTGASLVEKSAEPTPAWSNLEPNRWHDGETFVFERLQLFDLALGIKQTQLAALEESRAKFARHVSELAGEERDGFDPGLSQQSRAELDRLAAAVVGGVHARSARVGGVYYERYAIGGDKASSDYRVVVLVQFPRGTMVEVMRELAERLARSADPALRRLSTKIAGVTK